MRNYDHLTDFVKAAREIASLGLVQCSSGNLSSKFNNSYYITSTGCWMSKLKQFDIIECNFDGQKVDNDAQEPSIESQLHFGIYGQRPNVSAVLHYQSSYATVAACSVTTNSILDVTELFAFIPEVPFYINKICLIPFALPGSAELAAAVIDASATYDLILMQNHGQVVIGNDFDNIIQKANFFEIAAKIYSHNKTCKTLSAIDISNIRQLTSN